MKPNTLGSRKPNSEKPKIFDEIQEVIVFNQWLLAEKVYDDSPSRIPAVKLSSCTKLIEYALNAIYANKLADRAIQKKRCVFKRDTVKLDQKLWFC